MLANFCQLLTDDRVFILYGGDPNSVNSTISVELLMRFTIAIHSLLENLIHIRPNSFDYKEEIDNIYQLTLNGKTPGHVTFQQLKDHVNNDVSKMSTLSDCFGLFTYVRNTLLNVLEEELEQTGNEKEDFLWKNFVVGSIERWKKHW